MSANPFASLARVETQPTAAQGNADAELIRVCQRFAEGELESWYRYIIAPEDLCDAQDQPPDWKSLHWIISTPATTPEGWHAKALAYAAWDRDAYDDNEDRDTTTLLLASLLRDMVAPARRAILTRLQAELGPLPRGYDADWRFIGYDGRPPDDPLAPSLQADEEPA